MDLTILEVHLDDATFSASAPFAGESPTATAAEEPEPEPESEGGPSIAPLVLGLVVLAAVALGVRRLLGGSSAEPVEVAGADADTEAEAVAT